MIHPIAATSAWENTMNPQQQPAFAIRNAVAHRCNALGLEFADRNACENAALDMYWSTAASNVRCIEVGVELARKIAHQREQVAA